jgi:hypothetical protein
VISTPAGWSEERLGRSCILRPPLQKSGESALRAEIRYSEAVRPVLPAAELVREVLSQQPEFTILASSPPELCITAEGEYAELVRVRGQLDDRPAWHLIGTVHGDESMTVLDVLVGDPAALTEMAQLWRTLIYNDRLGLGVRKRRFYFTPPPGWRQQPSGLGSRLVPPDYPRQPATLIVHPAVPRDSGEDAVLFALLRAYQSRGLLVDALSDAEPVTSDYGLHGKTWALRGSFPGRPELRCDVLVFADPRYLYALCLESGATANRADLQSILPAVARSVRPIPLPASARPGAPSAPSPPNADNLWSF